MVGKPMEDKLTNSLAEYVRKRQEYIKLKQRLWWRLGKKVSNRLRDEVVRQRKDIKRDHETRSGRSGWSTRVVYKAQF